MVAGGCPSVVERGASPAFAPSEGRTADPGGAHQEHLES
jgi:hypothetical protein